jgi:hypothetical protein
MRAIILMFDSLNRHILPVYGRTFVEAGRLRATGGAGGYLRQLLRGFAAEARRERHTGRYNFLLG